MTQGVPVRVSAKWIVPLRVVGTAADGAVGQRAIVGESLTYAIVTVRSDREGGFDTSTLIIIARRIGDDILKSLETE